ncbi:DUF3466 family protein [Vibrio sp. DW001]|nr:DUF3466 family protein [Vibrio sp. DW001]WED29099.1 DUF3466 family protein [Vibrio sp. DW001]
MINMSNQNSTLLLSLLFTPFISHSALYRVTEVTSPTTSVESYGVSIEPDNVGTDCFSTSCSDSAYALAGDTLNGTEGFSYKEEVPFATDNQFFYLDYDDLEDYCDEELGYSTCEYWAYDHWYGDVDSGIGGLENEREAYWAKAYQTNNTAFYDSNTLTFTPDSGSNAPSVDTEDDVYYDYTYIGDTEDKVINKIIVNDDGDEYVLGNTSSGYYDYGGYYVRMYRQRGYYSSGSVETVLEPDADTSLTLADSDDEQNIIAQMGQTMAFDSFSYDNETYIVGSASVATFYYEDDDENNYKDYDSIYTTDSDDEDVTSCLDYAEPALYPQCQNFGFASRAFVWNISDVAGPNTASNRFSAVDWETDTDSTYYEYNDDEASAQASIRAASIANGGTYDSLPILVGYNTEIDEDYDYFLMQAAIFIPKSTTSFSVAENAWSTVFIEDVTVKVDGSYIHSNSVATDINNNLIVIGHAKRDGDYPSGNVTDNRMFIADANDDEPSARFFNAQGETIFFSSAGGNANAINDYNEIVGQVDAEIAGEVGGDQRDHRGFIYPYNDSGTDSTRINRLSNQAWWLDDLTNGGDYSASNNHFRIVDAGDINNAGVISATATQCYADEDSTSSIEYDSTDHWAFCNEGNGDERVTAVKLIPISGATSDDISERDDDSTTTSRSAGSINWFILALLILIIPLRMLTCTLKIRPFSNL